MLNLLVIAPTSENRERVAALLAENPAKISYKDEASAAVTLVQHGLFDVVLVAASAASEHALDEVRVVRRAGFTGLLGVIVEGAPLAWEESALGAGADVILREPLSPAHIESTLRRFAPEPPPATATRPVAATPQTMGLNARGPLEVLREFSHVLGYSLDPKLFAGQFVAKVRDIIGVSRLAVFLETPRDQAAAAGANTRLSCVAAIGVAPDIIECFALSRTAGIGARLQQAPQILLAGADAAMLLGGIDQKTQREFEILGCEIAIPISDRTRPIGVALLGRHFTGRAFTQDELQLLFLLMEELGSAMKNIWLHQQVTSSHRLLADVLAAMSSGCLVVDQNLHVLHANRAMVHFVKGGATPGSRVEFGDLPPKLAGPLYDTVVKGARAQPFFFTGGAGAERLFHVSIVPFHITNSALPQSAMLVLEDFTQIEAAKRFEIEASKSKLIALIAKRFAHEIRNSLVPLATHEQLLDSEYQSDDFRRSLKTALARETHRIQRFTEQMLYLAQPPRTPSDTVNLRDLIETCFRKASGANAPAGRLQLRSEAQLPLVRCHQPALEHAFQEILTNALQAPSESPVVLVGIEPGIEGGVRVTVRDSGPGFSAETARQALEPFFTTRNTGIGLGLTVARKIIEDHHGRLEVGARNNQRDHDIEVWLPAAEAL